MQDVQHYPLFAGQAVADVRDTVKVVGGIHGRRL
jgi:hypothetical protein